MTENQAPPLDAERWSRLKDHVADLTKMAATARVMALAELPLDPDDRHWLEQLVSPKLDSDQRLSAPHPPVEMDSSVLRWRAGDTIGRYRIEALLGRGGMGEVYEALPLDGGPLVALKVLRYGLAHSDYARYSQNEQRALQRLDDPRIARFIEAFSTPEVGTCLVLEWIDGEPLQTYCTGRRFSIEARLKLFVDVCQAVASAHQQLVVHRDLKPSNVLVTPEGAVKLLDFGVSKLLDDSTSQTETHGDLFTLEYAAPEQVLRKPVSTATDIYALGVMLYRLLTDVSPYALASGESLVDAILHHGPEKLASGIERSRRTGHSPPAGLPDRDLDRVIAHAMDKDPRSRYTSAVEFASDLTAVIEGRPILAGGGALYRMGKFVRRYRVPVAAAGLMTITLLAAVAISMAAARRAESEAHRARVANRFLLTTLDLTDRFSGTNQGDFTLAEVLERAVEHAHSELNGEPEVRADVLLQLSFALLHRGKLAAALAAASEAHAIHAATEPVDAEQTAISAQQLASIEIESGHLDDAQKHLDEALQRLLQAPSPQRVQVQVYTSLGKLASMRGEAEASLRWYQKIIPLRQLLDGDQTLDLAMDYNNLGTGLHNLSRFREAEQAYSQAISLLRQKLGATHPRVGYVMFSRFYPLVQLGRFDEAREMLAGAEAALGAEDNPASGVPGSIRMERSRAILDFYASNYASALRRLEGVVAQVRTTSPISVAVTLTLRGRVELASGDPIAAAKSFAEADALYVGNGRENHPQRWYVLGLSGMAKTAQGEVREGDAELEDAFNKIRGDGTHASVELAELSLSSGAAARRRGDITTALERHRSAANLQRELAWLGELGVARVDAELALDGLAANADQESKDAALVRLAHSTAILSQLTPHDPQLTALLAARPSSEEKGMSGSR